MEKEIKKEKIKVPPYQADRRSKQFEIVSSNPGCPRCGRELNWAETGEGAFTLWCYTCMTYYPNK